MTTPNGPELSMNAIGQQIDFGNNLGGILSCLTMLADEVVRESHSFKRAATLLAGWKSDMSGSVESFRDPVKEFSAWIADVEVNCSVAVPSSLVVRLDRVPEVLGLYSFLGARADCSELMQLLRSSRTISGQVNMAKSDSTPSPVQDAKNIRLEALRSAAIRSLSERRDPELLPVLIECITEGTRLEVCEAILGIERLGESHLVANLHPIAELDDPASLEFAESVLDISIPVIADAMIRLLSSADGRHVRFAARCLGHNAGNDVLPRIVTVLIELRGEHVPVILELIDSIAEREGLCSESTASLLGFRESRSCGFEKLDSILFKHLDSSHSDRLFHLARTIINGSDTDLIDLVLGFITRSNGEDLGVEWFDLLLDNSANIRGHQLLESFKSSLLKLGPHWVDNEPRLLRLVDSGFSDLVVRKFCNYPSVNHSMASAHRTALGIIVSREDLSPQVARVTIKNRHVKSINSVMFVAALREVLAIREAAGDVDDELVKLVEQIFYGGPWISESLADSEVQELKSVSPRLFQSLSLQQSEQ